MTREELVNSREYKIAGAALNDISNIDEEYADNEDYIGGYIDGFENGAEWAYQNLWHDAQGDDLPEDRQHCLIHYGGTKYCDFELAFFNAVDECFVTCSYPHPTGQSVISPGCDNDVLTDVYKNKRDKVSIKEIERWCVLEDILPK